MERNANITFSNTQTAPYRGPSGYQSRSQFYEVLNRFFSDGVRVRRFARFKRIGDKQGWGAPEYREGLELDRSRFLNDWKLSQAGARLAELAADGCEILSYKKNPAPGGMVTYILAGWPTNRELERNRAARVLRKSPKQTAFPRSTTPFQHPNPRHAAEVQTDWYTVTTGRERPSAHPWKRPFSERRMAEDFQLSPPEPHP